MIKKDGFLNFLSPLILSILVLAFPKILVFASSVDGTIDSTDRYAWSENAGWIDFGTTEGNVHVTDSVLTGYAWGEDIGWVSLNCSNDSSCGTVDYKVSNDGDGNLSGYAWSENAGWIDFSPTYGGVSIDSSGEFLGYAWGENVGWIVLNCATTGSCGTVDYKVKTDWRTAAARIYCGDGTCNGTETCSSCPDDCGSCSGGLPPNVEDPPVLPAEGFKIFINDDQPETNSREVVLSLIGGPDTVHMAISNSPDFEYAAQEDYQATKNWTLSEGEGVKTVYVKFYTKYGYPTTESFSDSIIYKEGTTTVSQPDEAPAAASGSGSDKSVTVIQPSQPVKPSVTESLVTFTRALFWGKQGEDVRALQDKLKISGFFPDYVRSTGFYGMITIGAVKAYQKANDIETVGSVGPVTRAKLNGE